MSELFDDYYPTFVGFRSDPETQQMWLWHSFCSMHQNIKVDCRMCKSGSWVEIQYVENKDE